MEIKKIPIHDALTCNETENVCDIAKLMRDKKERRIFVVNKEKQLVGVITTTDLVYKALCDKKTKILAKDVMTKDIRAVEIDENLNKALEIMNELKTFNCPITEKGKLLGVLSYHDVVGHLYSTLRK